MGKIKDYEQIIELTGNEVFLVETDDGTRTMSYEQLVGLIKEKHDEYIGEDVSETIISAVLSGEITLENMGITLGDANTITFNDEGVGLGSNNVQGAIESLNSKKATKEEVQEQKEALDVQKARIDQIASLPEGSTTGDAELQDIRVGADGETYTSAGNAVRGQIGELKSDLSNQQELVNECCNFSYVNVDGVLSDGIVLIRNGSTIYNIGKHGVYDVSNIVSNTIKVTGTSNNAGDDGKAYVLCGFYDSDDILISAYGTDGYTSYSDLEINIPFNAKKLIVNGESSGAYVPKVTKITGIKSATSVELESIKNKVNNISLKNIKESIPITEIEDVVLDSNNTTVLTDQVYNYVGEIVSASGYSSVIVSIPNNSKNVYMGMYVGENQGCFLDSDNNWISQITATAENYNDPRVIPENACYIVLTRNNTNLYNTLKFDVIKGYSIEELIVQNIPNNQWYGKKIVWLGTSVPFGANATKSYAKEACDILGANLINTSLAGQAIHCTSSGGIVGSGSTVLTKEEYELNGIVIPDAPLPYIAGGAVNYFYKTYENIFTSENADADLWVFDVAPNNSDFTMTDWDAFDYDNWKYRDNSSFASHRSTFYGALLFLMNKMYELNPKSRCVFILGSEFNYVNGKNAFEVINNKWNIETIDIWSKVNKTPPSLMQIKSLNGTDWHPSTFAHEIMGKMLANELLLIS